MRFLGLLDGSTCERLKQNSTWKQNHRLLLFRYSMPKIKIHFAVQQMFLGVFNWTTHLN